MRRVIRGAAIGAVPGILVLAVSVLLDAFGVVASDQSQVGFIGLPILIIGILLGAAAATARRHG